jgi:hypothetical protein
MSPATDQVRSSLRIEREIHQRRLALLEQTAARLGYRTDPATNMEIVDLRTKIVEIDEVLRPPKALSKEIWETMSPDERMEYMTTLILQLNADFESFYLRVRRFGFRLAGAVLGVALLLDLATVAAVYWIVNSR